jgi:hypothetical protein
VQTQPTKTADNTPFACLSTASALAREFPSLTAPELARRTHDACPETSKAACRRAADRVLDVRTEPLRRLGIDRASPGRLRLRTSPSRVTRAARPAPTLLERLNAHRRDRVRRAFIDTGFNAGPNPRIEVEFGPPDYSVQHGREWRSGRGGFGWVTTDTTIVLTVPERWGPNVQDRGLDTTAGLLTLSAEPCEWVPDTSGGSISVFRATWLRQGRGYALVTERGLLALHRPSGVTYHQAGDTRDVNRAIRALRRKLTSQGVTPDERREQTARRNAARAERRARELSALVDRVARWDLAGISEVVVTRDDSLGAGNCAPGTDAWIDRYLGGRESATIGEIASAVGRIDPARLSAADLGTARSLAAACLHAIRRDKSARRALAV